MEATDPSSARILELGCGRGINLLAMAQIYPQGEFTGIDLSEAKIREARRAVEAAGILNARFIQADFSRLEEPPGMFDYIICHSVYSMVPPDVRKAILLLCKKSLKPTGIAYISYNCLPGWNSRGVLREMMQKHTEGVSDMRRKVARARDLVTFLAESVSASTPYGNYLRSEAAYVRACADAVIADDFLAPINEPLYFGDFMKEVEGHGLGYLSDANPSGLSGADLSPLHASKLEEMSGSPQAREQYLDYIVNRSSRSSLLRHAAISTSIDPDPKRLVGVQVSGRIRVNQPFRSGKALFSTREGDEFAVHREGPAALFLRIAELGNVTIDAGKLIGEVLSVIGSRDVASRVTMQEFQKILIDAWRRRWIDLTVGSLIVPSMSSKPEMLPLARWQASQGGAVSTRNLDFIRLDNFLRTFTGLCDGSRDREAIVSCMMDSFGKGAFQLGENNSRVSDPDRVRSLIKDRYDAIVRHLDGLGLLRPKVPVGLAEPDFAAKVRWRMLHDRNPIFPVIQDKIAVKEYARQRGIKTSKLLFETNDPAEIPFDQLEEPFFIKANHGSGWNFLSEGKQLHYFGLGESIMNPEGQLVEESLRASRIISREKCIAMCRQLLSMRFAAREWAYHRITPRILVEEKLHAANGGELLDYRFYTFDGIVRAVSIGSPTYRRDRLNVFLTPEWEVIKLTQSNERLPDPLPARPECLSEMIDIASRLGKGIDFVRVDLYDSHQGVMLGEMTIYPKSGLPQTPTICPRFNRWLGDYWHHPNHPKSFRTSQLNSGSQDS